MNVDKEIFREILSSGKYSVLEQESNLSTTDLVEFIVRYSDLGVIQFRENEISLTESGMTFLRRNRDKIFLRKDNKAWADIPDWYLTGGLDEAETLRVIFKGVKRTSH